MIFQIFPRESLRLQLKWPYQVDILMPVLQEEGTDGMLFQQDGSSPHFQKEVMDILNSKVQRCGSADV